ncbi:MAG TPA: FHA domain-containing protein [Gemmataceae bacterium]|nr:FHA domain-containing protein [Gemmataceae bacterium]
MVDPRLNSVHLEAPRRQEFRRAREVLLGARGWQTVMAERDPAAQADASHTLVQEPPDVASPAGLSYWLVDGDCVHPLKVGLNTIGRSPDNDVVLQDAYVSRRHCAVLVHANHVCELHDIASKNGTFLNGRKIGQPTRLHSGDEIRMCDRQLVFLTKSSEPDPPIDMPTLLA